MEIIFAQPGERLICITCLTPIAPQDLLMAVSDDGAVEDYWCGRCVDFVGVRSEVVAAVTEVKAKEHNT